ncbi:response regulator transcription factor [Alicyclobacillus sp. SO9]|uniref:response regulator transcription factor n=1 Tax=Alicyclobacillus sp. SO9 TaxID=2665646 RepID=UPI0018E85D88|nr:response regulator transcription factor [Alicyclobacillus sp. SO9]QQE78053.1 response regulator transcription factor [Alicyclobacillus sp. SO9]
MKLLVIEDDRKIASLLNKGLGNMGHVVDVAHTAGNGWKLLTDGYYDLVVLDVKLPDEDGVTLCKRIRSAQLVVPIIMLTARDSIDDKVTGLSAGADDYLTKPFSFDELKARIAALGRRPPDYEDTTVLKVRDIELYPGKFVVKQAGEDLNLTRREFALLELLMRNVNRVLTRELILDRVWSTDSDPVANVVESVIARLRQKLGSTKKINP